ncbi:MAG: acyl dehydratase, partial [Alphaproteobacteria bacterium]|nr:acyl dehydratase [Alphaproteobacteria bacterium]
MKQPQSVTKHDRIDPARAEAWFAAIGTAQTVEAGSILPPFAHLVYFWDSVTSDQLGEDGH